MKAVWKWSAILVLLAFVLVGAVVWGVNIWAPYPGDPTLASNMLYKYSNPVPTPERVQVYTTAAAGAGEPFRNKPRTKWLKFESQDQAVIASLVIAMREGAQETLRPPPPLDDVVTYHIYFNSPAAKLPLYYQFYYRQRTNEPSTLSAYTTVGNRCNAEAVERWFETNGLLSKVAK